MNRLAQRATASPRSVVLAMMEEFDVGFTALLMHDKTNPAVTDSTWGGPMRRHTARTLYAATLIGLTTLTAC
jgi:hypothetical protein